MGSILGCSDRIATGYFGQRDTLCCGAEKDNFFSTTAGRGPRLVPGARTEGLLPHSDASSQLDAIAHHVHLANSFHARIGPNQRRVLPRRERSLTPGPDHRKLGEFLGKRREQIDGAQIGSNRRLRPTSGFLGSALTWLSRVDASPAGMVQSTTLLHPCHEFPPRIPRIVSFTAFCRKLVAAARAQTKELADDGRERAATKIVYHKMDGEMDDYSFRSEHRI